MTTDAQRVAAARQRRAARRQTRPAGRSGEKGAAPSIVAAEAPAPDLAALKTTLDTQPDRRNR